MARWPVGFLAGLAMLVAGVGCLHQEKCQPEESRPIPELPVVQRGHLEYLVSALPIPPGQPVLPEPPETYHALEPHLTKCRAAQESGLANMLDAEADSIKKQLEDRLCPSRSKRRVAKLQEDILRAHAKEVRLTTAGLALAALYRLAEAETLADLQKESQIILADALDKTRGLRDKGIKSNEDVEVLNRQQIDIVADGVRLQIHMDELNAQLNQMLALDIVSCCRKGRFWPVVQWHFQPQPPDCSASVAEGIAKRPELWMLQRIIDDLDLETLAGVREMLKSVNGLLGMASSQSAKGLINCLRKILCGTGAEVDELETKRRQVEEYRAGRVRSISSDITQDVQSLCRRIAVVALLRDKVNSWQARVTDLEAKIARGIANFGDLTEAKLQWIRARGDLIKEVGAWERDLIQLQTHQGILLQDCHSAPAVAEHDLPAVVEARPEPATFSGRLSRELSQAAKNE